MPYLTAGKGWQRTEAALLGCLPPGTNQVPLQLRLTRASLCLAVCERDPHNGVSLVGALQVRCAWPGAQQSFVSPFSVL